MNKTLRVGAIAFFGFLLCFGPIEYRGFAQSVAEDQLEIGLPDFPRRIQRNLPPLKPEQEIKYGILKLHPAFKTEVEYDDNIKLKPNDKTEDVIFTQTPALGIETKLGDHRLELGYGMEINSFAKNQEENSINHMANALVELNFNDFQLTAQDLFEKTTSRKFSEVSQRDRLLLNTVEVMGRYDRPMWALETGWRHNTLRHLINSLDTNDLGEDVIAVLGGYKILPKTLLLVENDIGMIRYRRGGKPDQNYWQIFGGIRGEVTEKFTATAKLGFQRRRVDEISGQGTSSNFYGIVSNVDFLYRLNDFQSLRFTYLRTVKPSTFTNNQWLRQDRIFLSYNHRFLRKWVLTPEVGWQLNAYRDQATVAGITKMRSDKFWEAAIELRYEIQEWLSTGLAYRFRSRNSNMDPLDFNNNRVSLDVTLAY